MKFGPLPKDLDLRGLATRGVVIKGTASLEALPRLREAGIGMDALAVAEFRFSRDEELRYVVQTQVEVSLRLTCQRCLEGMQSHLATGSRMACVWSDAEAAALPSSLEPLIVGEMADLNEILEEEILLAVPVSPGHEEDCWTQNGHLLSEEAAQKAAEPGAGNPFSVLEKLRT